MGPKEGKIDTREDEVPHPVGRHVIQVISIRITDWEVLWYQFDEAVDLLSINLITRLRTVYILSEKLSRG